MKSAAFRHLLLLKSTQFMALDLPRTSGQQSKPVTPGEISQIKTNLETQNRI
jgi:hypothetical protein